MEFRDVARSRRSIRSFLPDVPDRGLLAELVDIARRAPTAGFSQGVDFLVVDDRARLEEFWHLTGDDDAQDDDPPVLVFVFSDPERYLSRYREDDKIRFGLDQADAWKIKFWDVDASMAAMQLQLAAVDAGLGTWFFGVSDGEAAFREFFGVPEDRNLIGIIALGYRHPNEKAMGSSLSRRRRPLDEQFHHNGW